VFSGVYGVYRRAADVLLDIGPLLLRCVRTNGGFYMDFSNRSINLPIPLPPTWGFAVGTNIGGVIMAMIRTSIENVAKNILDKDMLPLFKASGLPLTYIAGYGEEHWEVDTPAVTITLRVGINGNGPAIFGEAEMRCGTFSLTSNAEDWVENYGDSIPGMALGKAPF